MEKKHLYEVGKELLALGGQMVEHYHLEGECPEIMSVTRLFDYAQAIALQNYEDDFFPKHLKTRKAYNFNQIVEIIEWFGESVYLIDFNEPPQSIKFIKEDK